MANTRTITIFQPDYRLRLLMLLWAGITFFWMSLEDTSAVSVALLGSSGAGLALLGWLGQHYGGHIVPERLGILIAVISGVAVGCGAVVLTTALMFFKTAWHNHLFPDYPIAMMAAMLARLPVWGMAGALIGFAIGMWSSRLQS